MAYAQHIVLQNVRYVHAIDDVPQTGILSNAVTSDITYNDLTVIGYLWGIVLPSAGTSTVNRGYYDNQEDFLVYTGVGSGRRITFNGPIVFGNSAGGASFNC